MLIAVLVTMLLQVSFGVYALSSTLHSTEEKVGFMTRSGLKIINWATLVLALIVVLLSTYLLWYHYGLIRLNTTTYKYIRAKQLKTNQKSSIIHELSRKEEDESAVSESDGNANSRIMDSL